MERGLWKDGTRSIPVAVKLLKEEATKMDKVKFLQEAAIMAQFRHPNIISLYGVVSKTEPVRYKKSKLLMIPCIIILYNYVVDACG